MAYNRWLSHSGVLGMKWGEKNGPPYPLDRSISDGHRLLKGDGSPQGKKRYKASEKTAHKRAQRKARTDKESPEMENKRREFNDVFAKGDPYKFISRISAISTNVDHRREQRRFEDFLKTVPISEEYRNLNEQISSLRREASKAENNSIDRGADIKPYLDAMNKISKLERRKEDEACRIMGLESSKLDDFDKRYLDVMLSDAHQNSFKTNKSANEKRVLSLWTKDDISDNDLESVVQVYKNIRQKSGDWYNNEPVSPGFKTANEKLRKARKIRDRSAYAKAKKELLETVLRDIGFEINEDNLRLIEPMVFDD